jgi:hypothetical protein
LVLLQDQFSSFAVVVDAAAAAAAVVVVVVSEFPLEGKNLK